MSSTGAQEINSKSEGSLDLRESGITATTSGFSAGRPGSSPPANGGKNGNGTKSSNSGKKLKKSKSSGQKSKYKKYKKVLVLDDSSDEDSDSQHSDDATDSGPAPIVVKAKSRSKKANNKKAVLPSKKQGKSGRTYPETDDSDSDTSDEETAAKKDVKKPKAKSERGDLELLKGKLHNFLIAAQKVTDLELDYRRYNGLQGLNINNFGSPPLNQQALAAAALDNLGVRGARAPGLTSAQRGPPFPAGGGIHHPGAPSGGRRTVHLDVDTSDEEDRSTKEISGKLGNKNDKHQKGLEFWRVDQIWDGSIHKYKFQDTAKATHNSDVDDFLFHVRRTFDWEGRFKKTFVDIKSKQLLEVLRDVIGNARGVSLVEEMPKLDPNMLFLYLEDLREHMANLEDLVPEGKTKQVRKKVQYWIDQKRRHLRVLIKYLDKDYAETKKSLYPLLENGLITFDLCWALWKPNTLAFMRTYGSDEDARIFKVEFAEKQRHPIRGQFFYVEGKYLEYDGKRFGYGTMNGDILEFRGARKITDLECYPLKYHKDELQLRQDVIERGKKFVTLAGSHYKAYQGVAYFKKKKEAVKVNVNGRIMVDPSTYRRINPNYPLSVVRPKDHAPVLDLEDSEQDWSEGASSGDPGDGEEPSEDQGKVFTRLDQERLGNGEPGSKTSESKPSGGKTSRDDEAEASQAHEFSEEEYLIACPVVLGFAFNEKLWVELSVSLVKEISWNETAYESLVLQPETKDTVRALVASHKYHAADSIDDVIQGKGKGLVFVLHGPPGTGKTLTAEGISELLKCPLYSVSAGDLGMDPRQLEGELQKILDVCHTWGAILLLDEADVFLEKRNFQGVQRNALVSIFLHQLEYYQGILFLTTNRVETFDDAFQSRIHIALRYDELSTKAKKAIFKIFIDRVKALQDIPTTEITEKDYDALAKHNLNGRQIKNTVRTAQALAVHRGEPFGMKHITQFLDVLQSFDRDLKGGTGYQDAMRSYF
ncbi:hypothetical protein LQW54_002989 [Pestalotiopsis sp. IQ-011]